jgi:hypothetical protein
MSQEFLKKKFKMIVSSAFSLTINIEVKGEKRENVIKSHL